MSNEILWKALKWAHKTHLHTRQQKTSQLPNFSREKQTKNLICILRAASKAVSTDFWKHQGSTGKSRALCCLSCSLPYWHESLVQRESGTGWHSPWGDCEAVRITVWAQSWQRPPARLTQPWQAQPCLRLLRATKAEHKQEETIGLSQPATPKGRVV